MIIKVQGFEHKALDILLTSFSEKDIITSRKLLPEIWYEHGNKNRRYYPDLLVVPTNTIIEVKSEYTYKICEEVNLKKKDKCVSNGYNFEFWIFCKSGKSFRKEIYRTL